MLYQIKDQDTRSSVWMNALQISGKSVKKTDTIYLDYAATSPLDSRVLEAMMPYLDHEFGNASSVHSPGRRARYAVEEAREMVAMLLGAEAGDIVFCSGGTEADNMALLSVHEKGMPSRLITVETEHEAVRRTAQYLSKTGTEVVFLHPGETGSIGADSVEDAVGKREAFVSVMHINNEIGVLNPVWDIAERVRRKGSIFHTDAVQSAEYYDLKMLIQNVDMLSLSAHKIGGPKGAGMLFVRSGASPGRCVHGGSQERNRRAGTENVAGIVGFARALELAQQCVEVKCTRVRAKRDRLAIALSESLEDRIQILTPLSEAESCPHILHALFKDNDGVGMDGEMLILGLDLEGIHVSNGSACSSGAVEPSHVMKAIGIPKSLARSALRISLSANTPDEHIELACDTIVKIVNRSNSRYAA